VYLSIGVQWNLVALQNPLQVTLFTPMKTILMLVWLCLVM
jgi:hypothetical protein